jgi:hypothetical protein
MRRKIKATNEILLAIFKAQGIEPQTAFQNHTLSQTIVQHEVIMQDLSQAKTENG